MALFDFLQPVINPIGELGGALGGAVGAPVGGVTRGITEQVVPTVDAPRFDERAFQSQQLRDAGQMGQQFGALGRQQAQQGFENQEAARRRQLEALGMAQMAAQGRAPSVAQQQLQSGLDRALAQQASLAASDVSNPALSRRNAMLAGSRLNLQTNQQAAQLRAQEMAQGRQQFAQQAAALRGADMGQAQLGGQQFFQGLGAGMTAEQQLMNAQMQRELAQRQAELEAQKINAQNQSQFAGGLISGAAGAMGGLLSDETAKENIEDAGTKLDDFARALSAKVYNYNDDAPEHIDRKRKRFGILAQDLERSEAGKSIVERGQDGFRRIDVTNGFGLALAAIGRLNERLDRIEHGEE